VTRLSVVPPLRRAAVLGSPIEHSLSPVLHAAAYRVLGLGWSYQGIECDELQLPSVLAGLDESFVGLSLTMPLKRAVLPLLDDLSELAMAVGAANTVLFEGIGPFLRRRGENTAVPGLVAAIRAARPDTSGTRGRHRGRGPSCSSGVRHREANGHRAQSRPRR
jgi:shikimate dehydrogenase